MAWYLNPALTRFRNEVNARWPGRDKASDGTIGDAAHQATSSDHNPDGDGSVDAWDMDNNGVDVNAVIAAAVKHEATAYVIWNRRITSRNMSGGLGVWHPYNGASPHTEHVHFNTRESYENSTKPWFTSTALPVEEDMTPAEFSAILNDPTVKAQMRSIPLTYPVTPSRSLLTLFTTMDAGIADLAAGAAAAEVREVARDAAQTTLIQQVLAAAGNPFTTEQFEQALDAIRTAGTEAGATALAALQVRLAAAAQAEADVLEA